MTFSCHNEPTRVSSVINATMQYSFYGLTDAGKVRTNNEDSLAFDTTHGIALLADGMGGYNAGEVAASMATDFIKSELCQWLTSQACRSDISRVERAVEMCVDEANLSILNAADSNPHFAGMGTTLVVGVFLAKHLVLGHVGDSRCYRLRGGELTQLTRDHSMLQEQLDAGRLTAEQAAVAPGRNLLTRALGVEKTTQIELHVHPVREADIYLLCSDGLTDMISDDDIGVILAGPDDLPTLASTLVAQALDRGGRDNVSVLLVQAWSAASISEMAFLEDPLA